MNKDKQVLLDYDEHERLLTAVQELTKQRDRLVNDLPAFVITHRGGYGFPSTTLVSIKGKTHIKECMADLDDVRRELIDEIMELDIKRMDARKRLDDAEHKYQQVKEKTQSMHTGCLIKSVELDKLDEQLKARTPGNSACIIGVMLILSLIGHYFM